MPSSKKKKSSKKRNQQPGDPPAGLQIQERSESKENEREVTSFRKDIEKSDKESDPVVPFEKGEPLMDIVSGNAFIGEERESMNDIVEGGGFDLNFTVPDVTFERPDSESMATGVDQNLPSPSVSEKQETPIENSVDVGESISDFSIVISNNHAAEGDVSVAGEAIAEKDSTEGILGFLHDAKEASADHVHAVEITEAVSIDKSGIVGISEAAVEEPDLVTFDFQPVEVEEKTTHLPSETEDLNFEAVSGISPQSVEIEERTASLSLDAEGSLMDSLRTELEANHSPFEPGGEVGFMENFQAADSTEADPIEDLGFANSPEVAVVEKADVTCDSQPVEVEEKTSHFPSDAERLIAEVMSGIYSQLVEVEEKTTPLSLEAGSVNAETESSTHFQPVTFEEKTNHLSSESGEEVALEQNFQAADFMEAVPIGNEGISQFSVVGAIENTDIDTVDSHLVEVEDKTTHFSSEPEGLIAEIMSVIDPQSVETEKRTSHSSALDAVSSHVSVTSIDSLPMRFEEKTNQLSSEVGDEVVSVENFQAAEFREADPNENSGFVPFSEAGAVDNTDIGSFDSQPVVFAVKSTHFPKEDECLNDGPVSGANSHLVEIEEKAASSLMESGGMNTKALPSIDSHPVRVEITSHLPSETRSENRVSASTEDPSVVPVIPCVRSASWKNCCGLFELFLGRSER